MSENVILLSDDDQSIRLVASKALTNAGYTVETAGSLSELMKLIEQNSVSVLVTDIVYPDGDALDIMPKIKAKRPDINIIMMSARSTLLTAVKAQESDVFAYIPKPFSLENFVEIVSKAFLSSTTRENPSAILVPENDQNQLIGRSPAMQEIFKSVARLVSSDLSVMIAGESGTGKEVVAKALHELGDRKNKPFVALNMAAIPRDLIESELFGHEKGAFTGADRRTDGRFSQAEDGTLFLDEIGDMPAETQTRLLRVLQDGGYTRVGGNEMIMSNARIIAATNQNLPELIKAGRFREDLYYRLNVVPLQLPPLRSRKEDVVDLINYFIRNAVTDGLPHKLITADAMSVLEDYHWPGNIRELENLIKRLLILVDEDVIDKNHILAHLNLKNVSLTKKSDDDHSNLSEAVGFYLNKFFEINNQELPLLDLYARVISDVERPLIEKTLEITGGNQIKAAEILGLNRNTLRKKITNLNISVSTVRLNSLAK